MRAGEDLSIRPLGLPEIIDRSVALTVRHFRALFLAMLVIEAPALALARVQSSGTAALLTAMAEPARAAETLAGTGRTFAPLLALLAILQIAATAVASAIVAPSLDPRARERPRLARRAFAVATAGAAQLVVLLAAPAIGALPGALLAARAASVATIVAGLVGAILGGLSLFLVALLRLALVPAAAAVEGTGGLRALARSSSLMAPRPGMRIAERPGIRASLVLLATFLLALAVNALAGLPRAIAARAASGPGPLAFLGAGLPLGVEIALSIFEATASAALQPFSLVAVAVFYFDRRARAEALDAEIWAERLEAGAR